MRNKFFKWLQAVIQKFTKSNPDRTTAIIILKDEKTKDVNIEPEKNAHQ